ncbi:MAG: restriction endonuclease subunit S [Clostridium sp.]
MGQWNEAKIGEIAEVKGGKRIPKGRKLIKEPNSHPYIRIRNLGKTKYMQLNTDYEYVDEETQQMIARYIVNQGDILISVVGTIGLVGIVGNTLDKANQTENCDKIINIKKVLSEYLYYYLVSSFGQDEIKKGTVGAVQPKLPLKNVKDIIVKYPPIKEQKQIVEILSAIDEKIELNETINNNLEQQAQAIYQQMFIENQNPNWKEGKLSDLVAVKYGKDHKKLDGGCYPVYGSGGIMRYVEKPLYTGESVLIPRKGTLNNVMYVNGAFWSVDTMFYTEMLRPNIAKFVYHFVKGKDLASLNAGSAVPSMTTNILNAMPLYVPDDKTLSIFEETVTPMYSQMQENEKQSANLANIRDTLLPRLMSGELEVSDIDL